MKSLSFKNKNFDKLLQNKLAQRRKRLQSNTVSVTNIIQDIKRNVWKWRVKKSIWW